MTGINETISEFQKLSRNSTQSISDIINDALYDTQEIAIRGISRKGWKKGGKGGGRQYTRGGKTVSGSAPGQYPMTDTGRLQSSIKVKPTKPSRKMTGRVGTNVEYGKYLEFGTSKMEKRPWLRRSFRKAIRNIDKELKAEIEEAKK
jgi:HK97 gp10 family phage protein